MASNKRKQDEKHLKMLREMVALPSNKTCFDCHQRGPTYVNMTIGSFVCTSCSGILRGLNPPHRVKSISMASFTPEELEFLKSHCNELNRKVYLGLYDNRTWPEPDSRDEQRVRDFMVQKYENKRFYVAPTDAQLEEAKRMNEAALSKAPQTKPLRTLLGSDATKLIVGHAPPSVDQPPTHQPFANFGDQPTSSSQFANFSDQPTSTGQAFADFGDQPTSSNQAFANFGDQPTSAAQAFANFGDQPTVSSSNAANPFASFGDQPSKEEAFPSFGDQPSKDQPFSSFGDQPSKDQPFSGFGDQVAQDQPFSGFGDQPATGDQPKVEPVVEAKAEGSGDLFAVDFGGDTLSHNTSAPPPVSAPAPRPAQPPPVSAPSSNFTDLLGMDSPAANKATPADPFASSNSGSTGGDFANFANFSATPAPQPQAQAPAAFPPMSAPLQPNAFNGGGGLQPMTATPTSAQSPSTITAISDKYNTMSFGDKYAAFAELETPQQEAPKVNWNGGMESSGGINWGGTGGGDQKSGWGGSQPQSATAAPAGPGGINWGGPGTSSAGVTSPVAGGGGGGLFGGAPASSADPWHTRSSPGKAGNPFLPGKHGPANPFGGSSMATSMPGQPNPFGAQTQNAGFGHPPASMAGFGQTPASSAGFGQQSAGFGQPPASTAAGFGYGQQYPMQNGGFGMASSTAGSFGGFGGPPTTAPPAYGVAQQQSFAQASGMGQGFQGMPQQQGFPTAQQPGFGGGWGQMGSGGMQPPASTANPFMQFNPYMLNNYSMSAVGQQQLPPRGGSTNPFL